MLFYLYDTLKCYFVIQSFIFLGKYINEAKWPSTMPSQCFLKCIMSKQYKIKHENKSCILFIDQIVLQW